MQYVVIYYHYIRINILYLVNDQSKGCLYEKRHFALTLVKNNIFERIHSHLITRIHKVYSIISKYFLKQRQSFSKFLLPLQFCLIA